MASACTLHLLSPLRLGAVQLSHRVVMAPLTRMRAAPGTNAAWRVHAEYYGERASAGGLLVAEASQISQQGQGYPSTPGCFTAAHAAGWRETTRAVHARGGRVFLQLWHVGRVSHECFQPGGGAPVSASAVPAAGQALLPGGALADFPAPRALAAAEIPGVVDDYRAAAAVAKDAGFDGVELHAANGYLLDQFLCDGVNQRDDEWGGTPANRSRLLFDALGALVEVWGAPRVGIRLSPHDGVGPNDVRDSDPFAIYSHVVRELSARHGRGAGAESELAYVHLVETTRPFRQAIGDNYLATHGFPTIARYRPLFDGNVIAASGFTPELAEWAVAPGSTAAGGDASLADAIAFGRLFLSTPDLPARIAKGLPPNKYDRSTFYTPGTEGLAGGSEAELRELCEPGYTDYPTAAAAAPEQLLDFAELSKGGDPGGASKL